MPGEAEKGPKGEEKTRWHDRGDQFTCPALERDRVCGNEERKKKGVQLEVGGKGCDVEGRYDPGGKLEKLAFQMGLRNKREEVTGDRRANQDV